MPRTVRVGDTVSYMTHDGQQITAEITAVTSQDDIDLILYHQDVAPTVAANVARATTWPPAVGTFHKEA